MNWINPRDRLPEAGELFWALTIENREDQYQKGALPCAEMIICEASRNVYGEIGATEINHKGYVTGSMKHFYDWNHEDGDDCDSGRRTFITGACYSIVAWLPYSGLPAWDALTLEESIKAIKAMPSYWAYKNKIEHEVIIEKNRSLMRFIDIVDAYPTEDGVYVVANKSGVWLSRYEKATCVPWIAPNGEPVVAWYPVPQNY